MSAPAGWYPTPEGDERYWDGAAWTNQIRATAPIVPSAPAEATPAPVEATPAQPTAAGMTEVLPTTGGYADRPTLDPTRSVDDLGAAPATSLPGGEATQQIGIEGTSVLPQQVSDAGAFSSELPTWSAGAGGAAGAVGASGSAPVPPAPASAAPYGSAPYGQSNAYGQSGAQPQPGAQTQPGGAYGQAGGYGAAVPPQAPGQPAYGQPAYGQPGGSMPPAPAKKGKGCLITALIVGGLVVLLVALAGFFAVRWFNKVKDDPTSILPSGLVSSLASQGLPSELASGLPSELPSGIDPTAPGGTDNPVEATIGAGFTLGESTIASGWTVDTSSVPGLAGISNMKATSTKASGLPLLFNVDFIKGGSQIGSTLCTAESSTSGADVSCIPFSADAASATSVKITTAY